MNSFSDMLSFLRRRENLSQLELANALGLSKSTISMYERGQRKPSFEVLEAIADYFNISLDTLMGWADDESASAPTHFPFALNPDGGKLLFYFKIDGDDAKTFLDSYQYEYPAVFRNDELSLEELKILYAWRRADEKARRKVAIDLEDYGFKYLPKE